MIAATTRQSQRAPYLFLLPFLLIFGIFTLYPLIQSVVLSTQVNAGPNASRSVGAENYRKLISDEVFWTALGNTVYFAVGCLLTQMPCALGLALLLNQKKLRGRAFFRLIFFSPFLMGLVFVALLVMLMFAKQTGLVNVVFHDMTSFLKFFGGKPWDVEYDWMEKQLRPVLVVSALWVYTGFNMIYFLAALQNVSPELLEAADIDGAGPFRRFWHVTLPQIRPVATYIALLSVLGSFQVFELPYILFAGSSNENGPHNSGITTVMNLYQYGFERGNLGRACAIGWILAILLMLFAVGFRVVSRAEET